MHKGRSRESYRTWGNLLALGKAWTLRRVVCLDFDSNLSFVFHGCHLRAVQVNTD